METLDDEIAIEPPNIIKDSFFLRARWYLAYALTLLLGMYWVEMDPDGGIFRLPTEFLLGFQANIWIEIPFMLTGVLMGGLVCIFLLFPYLRWWGMLSGGGLVMFLAAMLSWRLVFFTSELYYALSDFLPAAPWGMANKHFHVTLLYFLFFILLMESLIGLYRIRRRFKR